MFVEKTANNVRDLLKQVATFCKTELNWVTAQETSQDVFHFKSRADGELIVVDDIETDTLEEDRDIIGTSRFNLQIKVEGIKNVKSRCNKITDFDRVWFKGDANSFICVIKCAEDNLKWFGFGTETAFDGKPFTWVDASFTRKRAVKGFINIYNSNNGGFFGTNRRSYDFSDEFTSHIVHDLKIYYGKYPKYPLFEGGVESAQYFYIANFGQNNLNNSFMIGKTIINVRKSENEKKIPLGYAPLWYATNTYNKEILKQYNFGQKKFMLFSIGSTIPVTSEEELAFKIKCGNAGFALEVD